jgi:hypothetical protein
MEGEKNKGMTHTCHSPYTGSKTQVYIQKTSSHHKSYVGDSNYRPKRKIFPIFFWVLIFSSVKWGSLILTLIYYDNMFMKHFSQARCCGAHSLSQHFGGWGRRITNSRSAWTSSWNPVSKKKITLKNEQLENILNL